MALHWFLNPWAEVRRTHARLRIAQYSEEQAWIAAKCCSDAEDKLIAENTELKRKVRELHKYCSYLEGSRSESLCGCQGCVDLRPGLPGPGKPGWRYACEKCGNKRCPHHEWHGFKCTGSNEPGQIGEKE